MVWRTQTNPFESKLKAHSQNRTKVVFCEIGNLHDGSQTVQIKRQIEGCRQ